jgi:hypothetical protein
VNPRKSSTSSGNRFDRPRYLLVEVSGAPTLSPKSLEILLVERLRTAARALPFRVIRTDGPYGLVAIPHLSLQEARGAWNGSLDGRGISLRTLRTYGTLLKGKQWLARARPRGHE